MYKIPELIVTQEDIRKESIARAFESIKTGFRDTPIRLTKFEDNKIYVHDGHHRLLWKMHLGQNLYQHEYIVSKFTYDQYNDVNLDIGYITPFDPRKEVRLADFHDFKHRVYGNIYEYIQNHHAKYKRPRSILTMQDLYNRNKSHLF